jgi:hypothetical protein
VTVHDDLARLQDGAGEARAQDEGVQAGLEVLDERLTGQARGLAGVLVRTSHLLLAQRVLGAQTLLLTETDRVVRLGATTRTAVLAGGVRPLLEVLDGLGRQREAEGAGKAHLATRAGHAAHRVTSCRCRRHTR